MGPINQLVEENQLRWCVHIKRMPEETRRILEWRPEGTRPVGSPKKRWTANIKEALQKRRISIEEVLEARIYEDQDEWRGLVATGVTP